MKQALKTTYAIILTTLLVACETAVPAPMAVETATSAPMSSPILVSSTPTVPPILSTPTFNSRTFVITPDDLFSIPGLKLLSTPNSTDFCEHIPPPQIISNANELSILSGRFSLCPSRSRPLVNTAMDLDKGTLVSVDDKSSDISMEYAHVPIDGTISYYVHGLNDAHIDEIDTNILNYEYCKDILLGLNDPGVLIVHEGAIACVLTTEGKMTLIRVEHIYPLNTQGVEFSFAILK